MDRIYKKEDFIVIGSFGHCTTIAKTFQFFVDYYDIVSDNIFRESIEVNKESLTNKEIADEIVNHLTILVDRLNTKTEEVDGEHI